MLKTIATYPKDKEKIFSISTQNDSFTLYKKSFYLDTSGDIPLAKQWPDETVWYFSTQDIDTQIKTINEEIQKLQDALVGFEELKKDCLLLIPKEEVL